MAFDLGKKYGRMSKLHKMMLTFAFSLLIQQNYKWSAVIFHESEVYDGSALDIQLIRVLYMQNID